MKSPFPGMDPYIEGRGLWADFHDDLLVKIKDALAPTLPERYFIQLGERSYVVLAGTDEKEERAFYPDLGVEAAQGGRAPKAGGRTAVAEAARMGTPTHSARRRACSKRRSWRWTRLATPPCRSITSQRRDS